MSVSRWPVACQRSATALFNLVPSADLTIGSRDHRRERGGEGVRWKRAGNATASPHSPIPLRPVCDMTLVLSSCRFMGASLSAIGTYRHYKGLVSLPSFVAPPLPLPQVLAARTIYSVSIPTYGSYEFRFATCRDAMTNLAGSGSRESRRE